MVLSAETCVFAYLGMAIFSFQHIVKPALVIWSIVSTVCLFVNIMPYVALFFCISFIYCDVFVIHYIEWGQVLQRLLSKYVLRPKLALAVRLRLYLTC